MKNKKMTPTPSSFGVPEASDDSDKNTTMKEPKSELTVAADAVDEIDRPGFDLGGSSGDTQAGAGLGLGNDAFDKAGDRRLPGRRPDNELTIPRWSGPETHSTSEPAKTSIESRTQAGSKTKK